MDTLGIIRQVEADPALRAHLRAVLLGDEMVELPVAVRELAAAQTRTEARMDDLAARMDQLAARMEELVAAQTRTEARLEELVARVEALATATERRFEALDARVTPLEQLRGDAYERRARENAPAILGRLAGGLRSIRIVPQGELADLLDEAVDAGRLNEEERDDVLRADFIVRAVRRADRQPMLVVSEASVSADPHDVERAIRRASLAGRALEQPAIPVVVATAVPHSRETPAVEVVRFGFSAA